MIRRRFVKMTIVKNKFGETAPDIFIGEIKLSHGAASSKERNETKIDNSSTDSNASYISTGRKVSSVKDTETSTSSQMRADIQFYLNHLPRILKTQLLTVVFPRAGSCRSRPRIVREKTSLSSVAVLLA